MVIKLCLFPMSKFCFFFPWIKLMQSSKTSKNCYQLSPGEEASFRESNSFRDQQTNKISGLAESGSEVMPRFTKKVKQSRKGPITFSELEGSAQGIFCSSTKVHPPLSPLCTPEGVQRELCRNAAESVTAGCCLSAGRNVLGKL